MSDKPKIHVPLSIKIVLSLFLVAVIGVQSFRFYWPKAEIALGGHALQVQVADNNYRHFKGLSGRKTLDPYDGMLFIFPYAGQYTFVMRGMKFPLDIIWLDKGVIVDIAPNLPPEDGVPEDQLKRYIPRLPASMVLEVKAGWAAEKGVKIGDTLDVRTK